MVGFSFFFTKFVSLRRNSEAPRPRAGPFDKAIRQVHGGESNRTAHGPEQVERASRQGISFYIVPLPAYPALAGRGTFRSSYLLMSL